MTQSILAVAHSIGDSQMILASAKELAKSNVTTTLLIVGKGAQKKWDEYYASLSEEQRKNPPIVAKNLDKLFPQQLPVEKEALTLEPEQIHALSKEVGLQQYDAVLVGMPSYADVNKQCRIPGQLLEAWGPHVPATIFISDYAFFDPEHVAVKENWAAKATKFIVPFQKAIKAFKADPNNSVAVGHSSIDADKEKFAQWITDRNESGDPKINETRKALTLQEKDKLSYVAGGKAGDEDLVKALTSVVKEFPDIKIRIGLHPMAPEDYPKKLQAIITENLANTPDAAERINILPKEFVAKEPAVSTPRMVYAANSVLTVSSTVGSSAAACGKLAGFFQKDKSPDDPSVPYIIGENDNALFFSKPEQLRTFLLATQTRAAEIKKEQVVGDGNAVERTVIEIKRSLQSKRK